MKKFGIVGSGVIGSSLATLAIGNSCEAIVIGHSPEGIDRCYKTIIKNLDDLILNGLITEENKTAALQLLSISQDYKDLKDIEFVFEAIVENLELKQDVYSIIENNIDRNSIIASCTSSLLAEDLSRKLKYPNRFIIAHPFQPAHMLPLVELVGCSVTSDAIMALSKEILTEYLKREVITLYKNLPGFVVNRLAQAMFRESIFMIESGVASAEDIDRAIRYAVGMRYASIGLLEYFDAVGFELEKAIASNVYPSLCNQTSIQPLVLQGIREGHTGLNSGKGLYDWAKRDIDDFHKRKASPYFATFNWSLPKISKTRNCI